MNPEVQSKLQDDIDDLFDSKSPGEPVTQDDVTGLKYLDQVMSSTIISSKHPTSPPSQVVCEGQRMGCFAFTARLCTKSWAVPGSDFVIPADTRIVIPIVSLSLYISLLSLHSNSLSAHFDFRNEKFSQNGTKSQFKSRQILPIGIIPTIGQLFSIRVAVPPEDDILILEINFLKM